MNEIQKLIQELIAAGWKQIQISDKTGIPPARLSRWAAGEAPQSVCDALSIHRLAAKVARKSK